MKTWRGEEVQLHAILTTALDGQEWSASCSGPLTPGERTVVTHWIGDWMRYRSRSGYGGRDKQFQLQM